MSLANTGSIGVEGKEDSACCKYDGVGLATCKTTSASPARNAYAILAISAATSKSDIAMRDQSDRESSRKRHKACKLGALAT